MNLGKLFGEFMMKYFVGNRNPKVIKGKKHIACIGDSITFGQGIKGKRELTWEYLLEQKLPNEYQVINFGASGRTLQDEGDRPYRKDKIYQYSLDCNADIYLIMMGTNDAKPFNWNKERFEREYEDFISSYLNLSHKGEVILMTPPSCFPKDGIVAFEINGVILDQAITKIVKEIAKKYNLRLFDIHTITDNHPEWFVDGVHPNAEGNKAIANYIAEQLGDI